MLQTLMNEEKESHHTVKYRRLKERKRLKVLEKEDKEAQKAQQRETRKITIDVIVPGCGIFISHDLTQVHRKKKEDI